MPFIADDAGTSSPGASVGLVTGRGASWAEGAGLFVGKSSTSTSLRFQMAQHGRQPAVPCRRHQTAFQHDVSGFSPLRSAFRLYDSMMARAFFLVRVMLRLGARIKLALCSLLSRWPLSSRLCVLISLSSSPPALLAVANSPSHGRRWVNHLHIPEDEGNVASGARVSRCAPPCRTQPRHLGTLSPPGLFWSSLPLALSLEVSI